MKKYLFLFFLTIQALFTFGQGGIWTWISGTTTIDDSGAYGIQGVPSVNNHPRGVCESYDWKDKEGNFWIYGGQIHGGSQNKSSDLWKYNPVSNEWTWIKGNGLSQMPIYGNKGIANSLNTPGGRNLASASWVDTSGNLWMFGGLDALNGYRNDLWKYDISTSNWTWMSGDSVKNAKGVHGIRGIPDISNVPGARDETCSAWADSLNNLWLFGGLGYDDNGISWYLDDLCKYDIATNEWTWMKGSNQWNGSANYGIKGIPDSSNDPGGRQSFIKWKDVNNNFWIMGGLTSVSGSYKSRNDVWKYDVGANEWIWMDGPNIYNDSGSYQNTCISDILNIPYSRYENRASVTDNCGRFWMFGGGNNFNPLSDLWVFDPQQVEWEWLNGTNTFNQAGNYGTQGVPSSSNIPAARFGAMSWWGNDNKFYLFGGTTNSGLSNFADMWVFSPDTNCVPVCKNIVLAFTDIKSKDEIVIYPNPAKDNLQLAIGSSTSLTETNKQLANSQLQIFNMMGQKTSPAIQLHEESGMFSVDISGLVPGIYFVELIGDKERPGVSGVERWVGKFVKE